MPRRLVRTELGKVSAEGRVWDVIARSVRANDFKWTVRNIASFAKLSVGAVAKTYAWKIYSQAKRDEKSRRKALAASRAVRKST